VVRLRGGRVARRRACSVCFLGSISKSASYTDHQDSIPCIARSSGRLSRTRLRVRLPQSLLLTRLALAKSQPFGREVVCASMAMVPSYPLEKCIGDCDSGVATAPKLEMERGESSAARLRLKPMLPCCSLSEFGVAGLKACRLAVCGAVKWCAGQDGMEWK
jgi:hypothetical protein